MQITLSPQLRTYGGGIYRQPKNKIITRTSRAITNDTGGATNNKGINKKLLIKIIILHRYIEIKFKRTHPEHWKRYYNNFYQKIRNSRGSSLFKLKM